jgi:diguanylate cyclase (GGDEF)-like protein
MTDKWLETLSDALDRVEYGVALLDEGLRVCFINQAYRQMWALPESAAAETYTVEALLQHGCDSRHADIAPAQLQEYLDEQRARVAAGIDGPTLLRLADGRIVKYECAALPRGGRMLSYADQTDLVKTIEKLEASADIDESSQVHNRRFFYSYGQAEVARARRYGRPISVIVLEIDHFTQFNDLHGTAAGDALFAAVAQCCRAAIRATDLVARLGGSEFGLVLPETRIAAAITVAEKLRKQIAATLVQPDAQQLRATASLGVATLTDQDKDFEDLLRSADSALGIAKQNGHDRVVAETR